MSFIWHSKPPMPSDFRTLRSNFVSLGSREAFDQQQKHFCGDRTVVGPSQPSIAERCRALPSVSDAVRDTDAPPPGDNIALRSESTNGATEKADERKVITTFRWPAALDGREVSVAGSFSDWKSAISLRQSPESSDHVRSVALLPGTYQYKYKVDGNWATSPCESITSDGQGQFNNQRLVAESAVFTWLSRWGGREVFVTGDFTAWTELIPLQVFGSDFRLRCSLPPGTYSYQFLVDGTWMTSPDAPVAPDEDGHLCNRITVDAPPAFRIFYATGWQKALLHFRELAADGEPMGQWGEVPLSHSNSRAQPQGGMWLTAAIPATLSQGSGPAAKLEFYVTNTTKDTADKPTDGRHYICPAPGGFKLEKGRLTPFVQACSPPTMLVSDLDGTMVADSSAANEATQAFCDYWEGNAALAGGVLVYNTGRSLGQFISLMQEKGGALALPDVLITAVGTKIFMLDNQDEGRSTASLDSWKEDLQWSRRLDYGWDLAKVKQVAEGILKELEDAAHWLDQGTEHPHRIALSVCADRVPHVIQKLASGCAGIGLEVRVVVSGTGGWRYVDCVSSEIPSTLGMGEHSCGSNPSILSISQFLEEEKAVRGGKLEALEYVRTLFSIPRDRCVAAGDSGNDILMLDGDTKAIVVGNAQQELMDWLLSQPQDGRIVYTEASFAGGILEGIARHGLY